MGSKRQAEALGEVSPLLWSDDVEALVDWATQALGLQESWRAPGEDGRLEHAELRWTGGRISLNVRKAEHGGMGPAGISLRIDDQDRVDAIHRRALAAGADIVQGPELTRVAYSFTALDPDGNQWWVNAETGFLDQLRG
jgi:uncharacterized glyoxalase superfamily protein PhnB